MTPLDKTLKRGLRIKDEDYVVTIAPEGLKLTKKGHRRGVEFTWDALIGGDAALATALQASVGEASE